MIIIPPPIPPLRGFKGGGDYEPTLEILDRMKKTDEAFMKTMVGMMMFAFAVELVILGGVVYFQYFA